MNEEIKELQECIQINLFNIENGYGDEQEQRELLQDHSTRLAELIILDAQGGNRD